MAKEEKERNLSVHVEVIHQRIEETVKELREDLEKFVDKKHYKNDDEFKTRLMSLAFVHFSIKTILGLTDEEALECLTDGYRDFGIDAIHIGDVVSGEFDITIVQGKYVFNLQDAAGATFPEKDGVIRMFPAAEFIRNPEAEIPANKQLKQKIETIRSMEEGGDIPNLNVICCSNGLTWSDDAQKLIEMKKFDDRVAWKHVGPSEVAASLHEVKSEEDRIRLSGKYFEETINGILCVVGRMNVSELAILVGKRIEDLFLPNVRSFLGIKSGSINEGIKETILDKDDRENFYLFNNGLTVICDSFRYSPGRETDGIITVNGAYVLNGGQTCRTIQETVSELIAGGEEDVGTASVLVRLYEIPEDRKELAGRIALSTNSQNPVDLRDLKSNDRIQYGLEDAIANLGLRVPS